MLCQDVAGILRLELKTFRQEILSLMGGTSEMSHQMVMFEGGLLQHEREPTHSPTEDSRSSSPESGALGKSILSSSEPHASNTMTGARWVRMAQAIWHVDEARLKIQTAQRQQVSSDSLQEAFKLVCTPHLDHAGNISTDGMFEAAQAYNLVFTRHAHQQSRILASALQALRNNVTLRFCCQSGTCNFATFEAELLRVFGAGRIGMEGYDCDLRSQLFHLFDHLFPGFRQTRKRKRQRRSRTKEPMNRMDSPVSQATENENSSVDACDHTHQVGMRATPEDVQKPSSTADDIVISCPPKQVDSEDEHSQSSTSNRTAWSFPRYAISEGVPNEYANGMSLLGRLRSEMPCVAEECKTPAEQFVQYARNCKQDQLGSILELLQNEDEDFVATMRDLWCEFHGDSLCECCQALERYARKDLAHANEVILLLLHILNDATENVVRVACLDAVLHICRDLEEVLGLSGARVAQPRLTDLVRENMRIVLAPFTKEGGNEEVAIRVLARSAQLDQVLDIIGARGWLIEKVLAEIFYTLQKVISMATEDCTEIERAW